MSRNCKSIPELEHKLTKKQRVFIAEYQKDFNGTQAAIRAGYSPRTANEQAARLLTFANVKEAVEAGLEARLRKAGVTAEKVLTELARIAFHDIRTLYNEEGGLKHPDEWDDAAAAAVAGIEVLEEFEGRGDDRAQKGCTKKVRTYDKVKALEDLGKHLKLFADQTVEINIKPLVIIEETKGEEENA
ncbi:MAG: terminase small subunit [Syntrophorhabdales bacterium]|jgi:phage terminase small subunit